MTFLLEDKIEKLGFIPCHMLRAVTVQVPHKLIFHQRVMQKSRSCSKVWSPNKFGSMSINWIILKPKESWEPFQNAFGNTKFSNFTKFDRMTHFHTIKARNNRLFQLFNRFFPLIVGKGFETTLFLLYGLKPNPNFPKT